jgi:nucleoside-diphosphate-sugar epimerase
VPSILIAGCGYAGQATADLFYNAGWTVEGWTRSDPQGVRPYRIRSVDISDASAVRAQSGDFDAVIHCASTRGGDVDRYRRVYLDGAKNLVDAFPKSTVLFTSSTSVYAQTNGELVTEESETNPTRATSQVLLEAERMVLGRNGIVARLAGIYGPGRSALLDKFLVGEASVGTDYFVNQVHRDDIASALFLLLSRPAKRSGIYNVADGHPVPVSECYGWLARKLNRSLPTSEGSSPARKRGNSNKRVDNGKLRRLGWTLLYPTFANGMEESVFPSRGLPAG